MLEAVERPEGVAGLVGAVYVDLESTVARAELETDRFSNLIACGVICVAMPAPGPWGGPWVTTDQAPRRASSTRLRSSHISTA